MIRILFVCIGNSCRSPMAEGFANYYGSHLLHASSAGSHPARIIQPETIQVMQEKGIDISQQGSKGLLDVNLDWMDWVIVFDASLARSIRLPSRKTQQLNWFVADPIGRSMDLYRAVRDEIQVKVLDFIEKIREEI
jgi:arsenate reductase (thioredoxin)